MLRIWNFHLAVRTEECQKENRKDKKDISTGENENTQQIQFVA